MEAVLWIVLAIALAIGEAFTATFLLLMFAAGALAAAGAAALGGGLLLQVIVFAVVSGLSMAAIRPIIVRHARPAVETGETPIGMEALEGSHGTVLEEVDADRGFDGNEKYSPGERVRVLRVRGATAIVWRDDMPNV